MCSSCIDLSRLSRAAGRMELVEYRRALISTTLIVVLPPCFDLCVAHGIAQYWLAWIMI
jgi:hypothetical protein